MSNPCKCTLGKVCFAKRGHGNMCFLLTAPAIHIEDGEVDCTFRKEFQNKPKDWVPETDAEKKWAEEARTKVSVL